MKKVRCDDCNESFVAQQIFEIDGHKLCNKCLFGNRGKVRADEGWKASRWWRVTAPDGSLWCETSNEKEARSHMREGDTLERLYIRTENRWAPQFDESTTSSTDRN